jgi:hypothetical protein
MRDRGGLGLTPRQHGGARDLATRLSDLLRREHEDMAQFLLALADFDRRRAWEELGCSSLFTLLHRQLELSKGAASYRATAAALIQRVPQVVEPPGTGAMACPRSSRSRRSSRRRTTPTCFLVSSTDPRTRRVSSSRS